MTDITAEAVGDRLVAAFDLALKARDVDGAIDRRRGRHFINNVDGGAHLSESFTASMEDTAFDDVADQDYDRSPVDLTEPTIEFNGRRLTAHGGFGTGYRFFEPPKKQRRVIDIDPPQVERLRKATFKLVSDDFSWWATLCREFEALVDNELPPANAELLALEAMDWIVQPEDGARVETARKLTLAWLRSGLSQRTFCRLVGGNRTALRRAADTYFSALAERLNAAPRRPAFPLPATFRRFAPRSPDIATGVEEIAAAIRRRPAHVLRLIAGGRLPVAIVAGERVASKSLLRHSMRQTALIAA